MFTDQEKLNALKYPNGIVQVAGGFGDLAGVALVRGHEIREQIAALADAVRVVWDASIEWFGDLSGTAKTGIVDTRARTDVLSEAKAQYENMLGKFPALIDAASAVPDFAAAKAKFIAARDGMSGFNWALAYENPRHDRVPGVPFHSEKTVVGPHGDWTRATAAMKYAAHGINAIMKDFIEIYRTVPEYTQAANMSLHQQMKRFAAMMDRCSRVWAMHIEVETAADKAVIDFDLSESPPSRTRDFMRTLRQTELIFNNRTSKGRPWHGKRGFHVGIVEELQGLYFQEFIVPLGRLPANGPAWVYQLVVGDGNGGLHGFHKRLADWWRGMDTWSQSAFGFYHPLPDPAVFDPVNSGSQPSGSSIPLGFFDAEAAKIAEAKANVASANADLAEILTSLRAKEGMSMGNA